MFRGINNVKLDDKGRLALPVRFRDALMASDEGRLVVTIDVAEPCLLAYPLSTWEAVQQHVESLANVNARARAVQRLLIGHATDMELDGSGRIRLPGLLQEHASLNKQLKVVGQGNKIEIWSDQAWAAGMSRWTDEELVGDLSLGPELAGLRL